MKRRWILILIAFAVALALAGVASAWRYQRFLSTPMTVTQPSIIVLAPGTGYSQMVAQLRGAGHTDQTWAWKFLGWWSGQAGRLQAGEYRLEPGMRPEDWLGRLVSGDVVLHKMTIVEGWTFAELRLELAEHPVLEQTLADLDDHELLELLDSDAEHPEGWFLPETYRFPRGTRDRDLLSMAHRAMREALDAEWAARDTGLPLETPYQALILASIVEKETALSEERYQVAGVFIRRLQRRMRLQTDPTVIYGLGSSFDGDLRRQDLRTDTPYNTYTRRGLPPTPIALPGRAALHAALHPEPGDAIYFVARGDGSHVFSATLEEHEKAVDRYQRGIVDGDG